MGSGAHNGEYSLTVYGKVRIMRIAMGRLYRNDVPRLISSFRFNYDQARSLFRGSLMSASEAPMAAIRRLRSLATSRFIRPRRLAD